MNHTNTLLRVPKIFCVLKNKLHQMFSLKKLSQENISQIQKFFKTNFDADKFFELPCIEV